MGNGCVGFSPPRVLDEGEMKELCDIGAREMEIECVKAAMSQAQESLVIEPPDCVNKHKQNAQRLREAGAAAADLITDATDGDMAQKLVGERDGMLGKVFGFGAKALDKATEVAGKGAGYAVGQSLTLMADGLDAAIAKIEEPFTQVGKELVAAKHDKILEVYCEYINNYKFADALTLVRGSAPWGEDQYKACRPDAISVSLNSAAVSDLAVPLLGVVQDHIDNHKVVKAWDKVLECTASAYDFMRQYAVLEKFGIEKTDLDINNYIVTKVILGLGDLMAAQEGVNRASPHGKSRCPKTFAVVFSGEQMNAKHLEDKFK